MVAKKVVLIGIDAMVPNFVEKFLNQGTLPNMERLTKNGVFTKAIPSLPTITPPNWTTIVTGAEPAKHGITGYTIHLPGDPLDKEIYGFSSIFCKAEQMWTTAEKVGKTSIIIDYPGSYPVNIKNGIHVGEDGNASGSQKEISTSMCYTNYPLETDYVYSSQRIELFPVTDWKGPIASKQQPMKGEITISPFSFVSPKKGVSKSYDFLVLDSMGDGFDKLIVYENTDSTHPVATLQRGKWSDWITATFYIEGQNIKSAFRLKLLELSLDGRRIKIYRSQVYPIEGFTYPEQISQELVKTCGPYIRDADNRDAIIHGWIDMETYLEEIEYLANWYANAAYYLLKNKRWDLFFMKWYSIDQFSHAFWGKIDPVCPSYNVQEADKYWNSFMKVYQCADRIVGKIMDAVDLNDTLVVLTSDHGLIAHVKSIELNRALEWKGLLSRNSDMSIDWSRTKAIVTRPMSVFVNLQGRDPEGIVFPKKYEKVRSEIIDALIDIEDPQNGKHPVIWAAKKEDASKLGLGGEREGDVFFALEPGYALGTVRDNSKLIDTDNGEGGGLWGISSSAHGHYFPTANCSIGTMEATTIFAGAGINSSYKISNPVFLKDIAPTVCSFLGIPIPQDSQGKILFGLDDGKK